MWKTNTYVDVITCNSLKSSVALVRTRITNKTLFAISKCDLKENNVIHRELTNCIAVLKILEVEYSTEYYTYWSAKLTLESK